MDAATAALRLSAPPGHFDGEAEICSIGQALRQPCSLCTNQQRRRIGNVEHCHPTLCDGGN